jgi:hypothetical protein
MVKIQRFVIVSSSILILTLRTLTSCETNSTNELNANSNSNRTKRKTESETDTSKIELKKERKTELNENNFLNFSDLWKIVRTWSVTEPNENIKIQNQEFHFTNKRLVTFENVFVYVRKSSEAILEFKQVLSTDGSIEFRCEFYTTSLQEYERIIEDIDKKKFKPDRSKRSFIYRIGSYEDYTLSPKGATKRGNTSLYYWIEIVHYQGKEISEPVILE